MFFLHSCNWAELHWVVSGAVVSASGEGSLAVRSLVQEVKVHKELLTDIMTFLKGIPNTPRAKFLLNVPECIFHEEGEAGNKRQSKIF